MTKKVQLYNSIGKKQNKRLHFVYLDLNLNHIKHLKIIKDFQNESANGITRCFIKVAVPVKYYGELCDKILEITSKASKEGLYYGDKKDKK